MTSQIFFTFCVFDCVSPSNDSIHPSHIASMNEIFKSLHYAHVGPWFEALVSPRFLKRLTSSDVSANVLVVLAESLVKMPCPPLLLKTIGDSMVIQQTAQTSRNFGPEVKRILKVFSSFGFRHGNLQKILVRTAQLLRGIKSKSNELLYYVLFCLYFLTFLDVVFSFVLAQRTDFSFLSLILVW